MPSLQEKGKMVTILLTTIEELILVGDMLVTCQWHIFMKVEKHSIETINRVESCMPTQANPLRLIEFGKKGHLGSHWKMKTNAIENLGRY